MDIYFCDECGARVTDLDLRAGKGMRRRHATICAACVDQGLAQAWLTRTGGSASPSPALHAGGEEQSALIATAPAPVAADPISLARDRAVTVPDDPFQVDEPAPLKPLEQPSHDTDRLPTGGKVPTPAPAPVQHPIDSLSDAGGGFGALLNDSVPPAPPGLVDDPDEVSEPAAAASAASAAPMAQPETPFDFVHPKDADNPGKAETAEVHAVGKDDEPKPKTASGRQQAQGKRSSTTTSKRNSVKPASTRRAAKAMGSKKLMMMTLVSCGVMALIFFGLVMPNVGKSKPGKPEQINEEPYNDFKKSVDVAKAACHKALNTEDIAVARYAEQTLKSMMEALDAFQKIADKRGWTEENYAEALRLTGFTDVQSMRKGVKDRLFILEQRGK